MALMVHKYNLHMQRVNQAAREAAAEQATDGVPPSNSRRVRAGSGTVLAMMKQNAELLRKGGAKRAGG